MRKFVVWLLVVMILMFYAIPSFAEKTNSDISNWHPFENSNTNSPSTLQNTSKKKTNTDSVDTLRNYIIALLLFLPTILILVVATRNGRNVRALKDFLHRANKYYEDEKIQNVLNNNFSDFASLLTAHLEFFAIPIKRTKDKTLIYSNRDIKKVGKAIDVSHFRILTQITIKSFSNEKQKKNFKIVKSINVNSFLGFLNNKGEYNIQVNAELDAHIFTWLSVYTGLVENNIVEKDFTPQLYFYILWCYAFDKTQKTATKYLNFVKAAKNLLTCKIEENIENIQSYKYVTMDYLRGDRLAVDSKEAIELIYKIEEAEMNTSQISLAVACYRYSNLLSASGTFCSEFVDSNNYVNDVISKINQHDRIMISIKDPKLLVSHYTIESTYNMNPYDFEALVAAIFNNMGYDAKPTKKSGDQGVDVIAKKGLKTIAIQAKCYPNTVVGNAAIQEVVAGKNYYHATEAFVVTNSTFTKSAVDLANANNVTLWDRSLLSNMLIKYPIKQGTIQ